MKHIIRWLGILMTAATMVGCATIMQLIDDITSGGGGSTNDTDVVTNIVYDWPLASPSIKAAMVTPLAVMKDANAVKSISKQFKESLYYNSVCVLLDLQTGAGQRDYIFPGRTATALDSKTTANLKSMLDAGLFVILIVRNDWSARTGTASIPSVNGQVGNDGFYSAAILQKEKQFLSSLKWIYPYAHIQLNIEPSSALAANFALEMAKHLRSEGFANKLLVNPYLAAPAHQQIAAQLTACNVVWARSINSGTVSPDPIFNSDGNFSLNAGNIKAFTTEVQSRGKPYIIWTTAFADSKTPMPAVYFRTPSAAERAMPIPPVKIWEH